MAEYNYLQMLVLYLTDWGSHSIALGVNKASDLCEVAVALADVLDAGGLHQERIVSG